MEDDLSFYCSPAIKDSIDAEWAAKRRIADEVRRLIEHLVTCTSDVANLQQVASGVRQQADLLAQAPRLLGRLPIFVRP